MVISSECLFFPSSKNIQEFLQHTVSLLALLLYTKGHKVKQNAFFLWNKYKYKRKALV